MALGRGARAVLEFIATSQAYQSRAEILARDAEDKGYVYRGPRAKRLTAEQFVDAVWRLTGTTPAKIELKVPRAAPTAASVKKPVVEPLLATGIWSGDVAGGRARAVEFRDPDDGHVVRGAIPEVLPHLGIADPGILVRRGAHVGRGDGIPAVGRTSQRPGVDATGGATIAASLDHRIAMSFAVLGLNARTPVTVDDARPVATSFPGFVAMMETLGARRG